MQRDTYKLRTSYLIPFSELIASLATVQRYTLAAGVPSPCRKAALLHEWFAFRRAAVYGVDILAPLALAARAIFPNLCHLRLQNCNQSALCCLNIRPHTRTD